MIRKEEVKYKVPKPVKKGLPCPLCECNTVERDTSQGDGWFVEWCRGGVLKVPNFTDEAPLAFGDYTPAFIEFECPYYEGGFER